MSVLFVMPPGGVTSHFSEHLGSAFLRTMLARAGIRSQQFLPQRNVSLPGFARFLREHRPAVIGFTVYEANLRACRAMARAVREALPEAVVMLGGPTATFTPEEALALVPADLCMRGAGEGTIVPIVEAILRTERPRRHLQDLLAGIPNLVLRTELGAHRTRTGDLSSFPSEHFRSLDDIPSPYQAGVLAAPDAGLLTSRGCNQHCTYCSFAEISGRRVRYHSVERVLDDVAALKAMANAMEHARAVVDVFDDAFSLAPERARAICEGIVRRGLELPFSCLTRADRVDPELLRLMKRAGFVHVGFGLESAVPRVLRAIGKVSHPGTRNDPGFEAESAYLDSFRRAVGWARDAGLAVAASVIGGLTAETPDDFRETLAFVESLGLSWYSHNLLRLFPGTPLYRDREQHGLGAQRDPVSLEWRTQHAYDVRSVRALRNSSVHAERWEEAHQISDALCGWPRSDRADANAAWAVLLHDPEPDPALASWLPDVLAVHGAVVIVDKERDLGPPQHAAWLELLNRSGVPWGVLAVLTREAEAGDALVFRSVGALGEHRFEVTDTWPSTPHAVEADEIGNCRVQLWAGSDGVGPPAGDDAARRFASSPQIVDACRWSSRNLRCRPPRVLHVWPGGGITPCWRGPVLGRVGEAYRSLASRARAAQDAPPGLAETVECCPAANRADRADPETSGADNYELASQLAWILQRWLDHAER